MWHWEKSVTPHRDPSCAVVVFAGCLLLWRDRSWGQAGERIEDSYEESSLQESPEEAGTRPLAFLGTAMLLLAVAALWGRGILLEEAELIENKKNKQRKRPHVGIKILTLASWQYPPSYVIRVFIGKMVKHKKEQSSKSAGRPKLPPLRSFLLAVESPGENGR